MNTLRAEVQKNIDELQSLLNEYQDDEAFLQEVKEKWPDENDGCRVMVLYCQKENSGRLGSEKGEQSGKERINVPTQKLPLD